MTYGYTFPDTDTLERELEQARSELRELRDDHERLDRRVGELDSEQAQHAEQTDAALEEIRDDLTDHRRILTGLGAAVKHLIGQVAWLEHHVLAGTGLRPANLNQADAEVLDLISKVRADIRARATLLGQARRTDLERVIQRYEQTQRSQLTYVSEALGHSKKIAATATGSESHTTAASAFRAARQRAAALDDQLSRDQPACREGQAELARDDQRRAAAGPAMLAGQRADAALRTRIRARINTMLSNFDLPPAWFTAALGYRPPAQATASWLETATDLLVYRITHGISHQTAALGEARPAGVPGQRHWHDKLAARLDQLRQWP